MDNFEILLFERNTDKNRVLIFSIVFIIVLAGIPNAFATPTVTIQMEKTVYSYGEKLFYEIEVSEIIDDVATIYIVDEQGKRSSGIPIPITELKTAVPSTFPFESEVFPVGKYFIEVEYSGVSDSIEFELIDSGNIVIPFWIKQVAYYWLTDPNVSDETFANALEFLIQNEIIVIPEAERESTSDTTEIPTWVKMNTMWWLEEKISDTDFALGIQYLIKVGIIVI